MPRALDIIINPSSSTTPTWVAERDLYINLMTFEPGWVWLKIAQQMGWARRVDFRWMPGEGWSASTLNPVRRRLEL
jgi:hypothetical protein